MESQQININMKIKDLIQQAERLSSFTIRDRIVEQIYNNSQEVIKEGVSFTKTRYDQRTEKLDAIFTSPIWGYPIMLTMLGIVFYLTIAGANIPSSMLASFFSWVEGYLSLFFNAVNAPEWLHGVLVLGLFRGTSWVISVMLPPMAIFFLPLHY